MEQPGPPPEALLPGYDMPNRGPIVIGLNIALMTVSTGLVVSRFYVRQFMTKNLGPDDWVSLLALVVLIVQSAMDMHMAFNGAGRHIYDVPPEQLEKFFKTLPTAQLLFFTGSSITRMAILLFLRRLVRSYKWLWPGIIGLVAYFISFFFAFLLQCQPIQALWDKDLPEATYHCITGDEQALIMYVHSGVGIAIDIGLLITPLIILWRRLMFRKMKFRMLSIFSVGLFAVAAGITRLCIITSINMAVDTTWKTATAAMWTDLEVHAGLIVSCFPAIHPLVRMARKAITGQSTTKDTKPTYRSNAYNSHGNAYGKGTQLSSNGGLSGNPHEMYTIKTKVGGRNPDSDSQENIVGAMGMGIYKSTDVEVRVDDRSERNVEDGSSTTSSHVPRGPDRV